MAFWIASFLSADIILWRSPTILLVDVSKGTSKVCSEGAGSSRIRHSIVQKMGHGGVKKQNKKRKEERACFALLWTWDKTRDRLIEGAYKAEWRNLMLYCSLPEGERSVNSGDAMIKNSLFQIPEGRNRTLSFNRTFRLLQYALFFKKGDISNRSDIPHWFLVWHNCW